MHTLSLSSLSPGLESLQAGLGPPEQNFTGVYRRLIEQVQVSNPLPTPHTHDRFTALLQGLPG